MFILVPGGRACTEQGALCTSDGRPLDNGFGVSIPYVPPLPALSIADAEAQEGPNASLRFEITLSEASDEPVTFHIATSDGTAIAGEDYVAKSRSKTLRAGRTTAWFRVHVIDDDHDEGDQTFTVTITNVEGAYVVDGEANGTIRNSDPMPKAWMIRFGRTVGAQIVDAVGARLDGGGGNHVTVGGVSLTGAGAEEPEPEPAPALGLPGWEKSERLGARTQGMSGRELLMGTRFNLSTGGAGPGPALGAWGHFATSAFEGEEDDITVDGDVTTGLLGADVAWDRALAGIVISHSAGDGGYENVEDDRGGTVESTLTGVYPYARPDLTESVSVWALAGGGSGALTLAPEDGWAMRTDVSMRMGALGVKGRVLEPGQESGLALDVRTDALWVGTETDRTDDLASSEADASRVRLIVEGTRAFETASGGTFTPTGELGVRYDEGDAETGAGLEVGAGLRYGAGPLAVEGRVRGLVAHADSGYREWGASARVTVQPDRSGWGLSLSVAPVWGDPASGAGRLWSARDARELDPSRAFDAEARLDAEMGYGFAVPHGRGLVTPYAGLTLADEGAGTYRAGARWDFAPGAALGIEGTRSADDSHSIELRVRLAW